MKLLNSETLTLEECHQSNIPDYAILSHRWGDTEISYTDITSGRIDNKLDGHAKVEACCELALSRGLRYIWIDTCCIDKSSSAELTESINSMYKWYQRAKECYAYLNDVYSQGTVAASTEVRREFQGSIWFTRGWTLQELIAPSEVLFYNKRWGFLGSKRDLTKIIEGITDIESTILSGARAPSTCSIAQRMSWAAGRKTTRPEDEAYSLLGLFNINMPMLYGEEYQAFQRLQEEIIRQSDDQTLLAWSDTRAQKEVLAPSVSCFRGRGRLRCIYPTNDTRLGYSLGNAGLSIHLMLIPWAMNTYLVPLSCGTEWSTGRSSIRGYIRTAIFLRQTEYDDHLVRVAMLEQDTTDFDADYIAGLRDRLAVSPRKVFLRQNVDMAVRPLAYGFRFFFGHEGMFATGRYPRQEDVRCANEWVPGNPCFEVATGSHKIAGTFRLSGATAAFQVHFMHFGFDLNFAPVCLITTEVPGKELDPAKGRASSFPETDLYGMESLLSAVQKADSPSTVLAFTGQRERGAEIKCTRLGLKLTFKITPSADSKPGTWHVLLEKLPLTEGLAPPPTSSAVSPKINQDQHLNTSAPTLGHHIPTETSPTHSLTANVGHRIFLTRGINAVFSSLSLQKPKPKPVTSSNPTETTSADTPSPFRSLGRVFIKRGKQGHIDPNFDLDPNLVLSAREYLEGRWGLVTPRRKPWENSTSDDMVRVSFESKRATRPDGMFHVKQVPEDRARTFYMPPHSVPGHSG